MPQIIPSPTVIQSKGNKPKKIEEFVGRVNTQTSQVSIARMVSPSGWVEPGQTPEFDEYTGRLGPGDSRGQAVYLSGRVNRTSGSPKGCPLTVVLKGSLRVESKEGFLDVKAGQAVWIKKGEWVRYSSPAPEGAEYVAVCLPAFGPEIVHRDS